MVKHLYTFEKQKINLFNNIFQDIYIVITINCTYQKSSAFESALMTRALSKYRHQSFYYNTVIVTLLPIEFTSADINCSFYVRCIAVWKLQFLKPLKYRFSFCRLQTMWSPWSFQISLCIYFGLQRRTATKTS
jgi:hypothetical protein